MDLIAITDTETTGVRSGDVATELGIIVYSLKQAAPVLTFGTLLPTNVRSTDSTKGLTAEELTGIGPALLHTLEEGPAHRLARGMLDTTMGLTTVFMAHQAAFDRRMLVQTKLMDGAEAKELTWVCSMNGMRWPRKSASKALSAIALAHGVPIVAAHRALTDCDILVRLLTHVHDCGHDIVRMVEEAAVPLVTVCALVSKANKDLAANNGFYFHKETLRWLKEVRETDLGALDLPFRVEQVPPVA